MITYLRNHQSKKRLAYKTLLGVLSFSLFILGSIIAIVFGDIVGAGVIFIYMLASIWALMNEWRV